jgi:hypothetical protein
VGSSKLFLRQSYLPPFLSTKKNKNTMTEEITKQTFKSNAKINNLLITLFNGTLPDGTKTMFSEVNRKAVLLGFIVHPDVCNNTVSEWLDKQAININSTFYKKWNDILSKSRFELWIDQVSHYASTYGTDFQGDVYLPEGELDVHALKNMKVIGVLTPEDIAKRCDDMLYSGIALNSDTVNGIIDIMNFIGHKPDVNLVRNKEAKLVLYKSMNLLPSDPQEMVRYLVYLSTGETMVVKNRALFKKIQVSNINITKSVTQFGISELSSVFLRNKALFLAFKKANKENRSVVNRLRKEAVNNHVPHVPGFFESILSNPSSVSELEQRLVGTSTFKKVRLLQSIMVRKKELNHRAFVVRNQKLFIKEEKVNSQNWYDIVYDITYKSLISDLSQKTNQGSIKVKLPKGVSLTLPTSEKSFIGNYPLGTSFDMTDSDCIVGINWRSSEGANDLDLSLMDLNWNKYGWNSNYRNSTGSVVYSGDMTSAYPEATELFYASKGFTSAILKVNLYSGQPQSKFRFFVARENIKNMSRNYMVNPDNVLMTVESEMDSREKSLGVIMDNRFVLAQFRTGRGSVSFSSVTDIYTDIVINTLDCYLSMEKVLTDAGFQVVFDGDADVDLTNLSKDTLISLFS